MRGALLSIGASLVCIVAVLLDSWAFALVGFMWALFGLAVSVGEHLRDQQEREQLAATIERARREEAQRFIERGRDER